MPGVHEVWAEKGPLRSKTVEVGILYSLLIR